MLFLFRYKHFVISTLLCALHKMNHNLPGNYNYKQKNAGYYDNRNTRQLYVNLWSIN